MSPGQAQTGTGKTAAFLVALYQNLLTRAAQRGAATECRARDLHRADARARRADLQRRREARTPHGPQARLRLRGVDYEKQRRQFEDGADILIGTPGRIIDYFKQQVFDLRHVQVVVMDEADRMFDLGFIADIRYLLRKMPDPDKRQSMLFSATLSHRVLELAYEHMNDPELVRIETGQDDGRSRAPAGLFPAMEEKIPLLIGLLRQAEAHRTMVFVNTRRQAERLEQVLRANGINAQALSGDVPQNKRLRFPARVPRR